MNKLLSSFNVPFCRFILVGIINTIASLALMFLLYNFVKMGYWGSSCISYFLTSTLSFFLNKTFTFNNKNPVSSSALKFALTIAVCYIIAFSIAKPLVFLSFKEADIKLITHYAEQIAMIVGMVLFTFINYYGQILFAFKSGQVSTNDAALTIKVGESLK